MLSKLSTGLLLFSSSAFVHVLLHRKRVVSTIFSHTTRSLSASSSSSIQPDSAAKLALNSSDASSNSNASVLVSDDKATSKFVNESKDCACKERKSCCNTVKSYEKHVIICGYDDPVSWASVIEDEDASFAALLGQRTKAVKLKGVKMSGCTRPNSYKDKTDVIVYPEGRIYHMTTSDIDVFVDCVLDGQSNSDALELQTSTPSWSNLILICVHGNRDRRCGVQGRETYLELLRLTEQSEEQKDESASRKMTQVFGSTHLGGHEFAGTCVVYPESSWFGYLTKADAEPFLHAVEAGQIYGPQEFYRGKGLAI